MAENKIEYSTYFSFLHGAVLTRLSACVGQCDVPATIRGDVGAAPRTQIGAGHWSQGFVVSTM